jgi:hypothetical protein
VSIEKSELQKERYRCGLPEPRKKRIFSGVSVDIREYGRYEFINVRHFGMESTTLPVVPRWF